MANHFSDPHLCPVCWENWVRGKGLYCGDECRSIAHKFLDRTGYYRKVLSEIGFRIEQHDGIFTHIEIPADIMTHYPKFCHNFVFPAPGMAVDCLNGGSLLDTVRSWLGAQTVEIVRQFSYRDFNADVNFAFEFAARVSKIWAEQKHVTTCSTCARNFIISEQGWDANTDQCTDCANASIPVNW